MAMKLGSNVDLNKVVKSLGQKYKLVPLIDMEIGKGDFVWDFKYEPKRGDDAWHPSGDCTPSLHDLYRKATLPTEERVIPASLAKTFMVGHFWHAYLQWIVEKRLGLCKPEAIERRGIKVWGEDNAWGPTPSAKLPTAKPYHWATGAGDIAPCSIPGHGDFAIDFKTMNARMFQSGPPPDYMGKWECQGNIYMDFFDMEKIIFVGVCKDSPHDMKEWVFTRNQPLIDAIYLKWKIVSQCLDEGIEPPEDEEISLPLQGPDK